MTIDDEALIERTLRALSALRCATERLDESEREIEESRDDDCTWAELLAAIMEGFERGWIERCNLWRENDATNFTVAYTDRGERAVAAYRRRNDK